MDLLGNYEDVISNKLFTNRIALIDADFIKYIVCNIRKKELEEEALNPKAEIFIKELPIIRITKDYLQSTFFNRISDPMIFCFSGKSYNTFRNAICFQKEYKASRKLIQETYSNQFADSIEVVKYIKENYATLLFEDLEADDVVSVLQDLEFTYIVSKDKDLKQVPGYHYDFLSNSIYEIDNKLAIYNLAYQLLAGDSVDNIPGFPNFGEVKTKKFLAEIEKPSQYVNKVFLFYQQQLGVFKGVDLFVENWNLVKMRMDRGDHFKSKYKKMYDTKEFFVNRIKVNLK